MCIRDREKKVRPALLSHEGDVQIVEYADGVLKIRLTGHCSGCPSARLTTEELIAAEVQKEIPEVKEVVLVNEISPELLDFARKLLNHNHEAVSYTHLDVYKRQLLNPTGRINRLLAKYRAGER